MSEPNATAFPLEPIWTPDDFADTVRDASQHEAIRGEAIAAEDMQPDPGARPFWRNPRTLCPCCHAWPLEECEASCLSRMSPAEQERHRAEVIEAVLADLDRMEGLPSLSVPDVDEDQAEPAGMRPSSARRTNRLIVAVAVLLLVCSLGVAWLLVTVPA